LNLTGKNQTGEKNMSISKLKNQFYLLLIGIIFVTSYFFIKGGVIYFDDGFFPFNPYQMLDRELSLFNYPFFLGAPYNYTFNYIPFTLFSAFFITVLHLPYWIDEFLYISTIQAIGAIGTFRLITKLIAGKESESITLIGAFFGSLLFTFNFTKVITINEFYPVFISINFLPLLLSYITDLFRTKRYSVKLMLYISLISLVMASGYYESTFTLIIVIGILSFLFYCIFYSTLYWKDKIIKFSLVVLIISLTSVWVVPSLLFNTFAGFVIVPTSISKVSTLVVEMNYNHSLSLMSFITLDYELAGYSVLPLVLGSKIVYYIGLTIGLFFASQLFVFLPKKNEYKSTIKFFDALLFTLFVIGLIDWPSQLLLNPYFSGTVFTLTISWEFFIFQLWLSIIIGLSIPAFLTRNIKKKEINTILPIKNRGLKPKTILKMLGSSAKSFVPIAVIIILLLGYSIPIAVNQQMGSAQTTGFVLSTYHPSKSIIETGDFLSQHSKDGDVLVLPVIAGDYLINGSHSLWAVTTPLYTFTSSFLEYRDRAGANNTMTYPILTKFQTEPSGNIYNYLALFGIKYIIISKNLDTSNYIAQYNATINERLQNYFNSTARFSYVESLGNYTIFRLDQTNPIIYAGNAYDQNYLLSNNSTIGLFNTFVQGVMNYRNDSVFCGLNYNLTGITSKNVNITWKQTSLNSYTIDIKSRTSFALNFLEGYSKEWGNFKWELRVDGQGIDHKHYVSNLFANGWIMPSGNYTATIFLSYAATQNIVYVVSLSAPVFLLLYTGTTYIRRIVLKKI